MLDISKRIADKIRTFDDIKHGNVYNLIQDDKASSDFIVVELASLAGDYTKDYESYYDVKFNIVIISNQFDKGNNTSILLNNHFEKREIDFDDYILTSIQLANFSEKYAATSYINTLTYTASIHYK
jgi:hypothetical protein